MAIRNAVQLITYPDSLGGDLAALSKLLSRYYRDALGGIHLLPFYPSTADRGFAPTTYDRVDPSFGSWEHVASLQEHFQLTVDYMINHISRQSEFFQDFVQHHDRSRFADMFVRFHEFWPGGEPTREQLDAIYKRKPRDPYVEVSFEDGTSERVWCTFDEEQIDLDWRTQTTKEVASTQLRDLAERGVAMVRLDAFAYATKRPGTNCFFLEPEVWEILGYVRDQLAPYGVELLPELHEHYSYQLALADHGYWVYDFALPMLLLHTLYEGNARNLRYWFHICPRYQMTTLDTHDGIGVVDVRDLMSDEQIEATKQRLFSVGAKVKRKYNAPEYNNLDIYQLNCTYFSALGNDPDAYLLARTVQFFWPGVPQVYYVGMLAGENDIEKVEQTKVGRNINRHDYSAEEVESQLERPVVRRLRNLMRFRSQYPVFDGAVACPADAPHELRLRWTHGASWAELSADLSSYRFTIRYIDRQDGVTRELDLDDDARDY
jgi:sucrose phosphorylase